MKTGRSIGPSAGVAAGPRREEAEIAILSTSCPRLSEDELVALVHEAIAATGVFHPGPGQGRRLARPAAEPTGSAERLVAQALAGRIVAHDAGDGGDR